MDNQDSDAIVKLDKFKADPKKNTIVRQSDKRSLANNLSNAISGIKDFDSDEIREFKKNMKSGSNGN